jgi:hypothetical protein
LEEGVMNKHFVALLNEYLEEYEIFISETGEHEDEYLIRPEAYIRGRLMNDFDRVLNAVLSEYGEV